MCIICGTKNSGGIKACFYETDQNSIIAVFTPREEHQGYPGRLHGGIAAGILDETIGRAILLGKQSDVWGVTVEMNVRFRKPLPLDVELRVIGRMSRQNRRIFEGTGEIVLPDGSVAVSATGKYIQVPLEKISDALPDDFEWKVTPDDSDPSTIII